MSEIAEIDLEIENTITGLRDYGYRVTAKPVPGHEAEYHKTLQTVLRKLDATADFYRRQYRIRSHKRLQKLLWHDLPEPTWGVHAPQNGEKPY